MLLKLFPDFRAGKTPGYTCQFRKGTRSPAGHLCVLATPARATHPVTDVSTSCISGTTSVRLLSCRDPARSTLPLCGRRGGNAGQRQVSAAAASWAPCYSSTYTPRGLARHLIYPSSVLLLVPGRVTVGTQLSPLCSPHKDVTASRVAVYWGADPRKCQSGVEQGDRRREEGHGGV